MADEQAGEQPKTQPEEQPKAAQVDYEKLASILDGRIKTTEESVLRGYFKDQGITGDEAAEAIRAFKDAKAARQPDVDGMQAQIDELRRSMEDASRAARVAKVENAVIVEAAKMGIDPKAIPYLTRMADLTDVGEGDSISADKVAEALGKVLDDLPALRPQATQQQGFRVGGEGAADGEAPKADDAKIRAAFGVK